MSPKSIKALLSQRRDESDVYSTAIDSETNYKYKKIKSRRLKPKYSQNVNGQSNTVFKMMKDGGQSSFAGGPVASYYNSATALDTKPKSSQRPSSASEDH